jgi:6-phosphogluconate dehydrogenase
MQIGLVGLGRMGADKSRRLLRGGHTVVGYARHAETVDGLLAEKAISAGATSLKDMGSQLATPLVVWLMAPAASVDGTLDEVVPLPARRDVVVDGGDSYTTSAVTKNQRVKP